MPLSLDDYKHSLNTFANRIPELLRRHEATSGLALEVDRLELGRQLERKFTMAVVGLMRAGKSTLINALIGRYLAPVGVDATTATINWFDHAEGAVEHNFDIIWRDSTRPPERRPVSECSHFIGEEELAQQAELLRFYANSEFLKEVHIVDTPGKGAMNEHHERTINEFVTRRSIDRADAVILALPLRARGAEIELLETFERESRLPGQGPYNTIAVIQKWETLEDHRAAEDRVAVLADDFGRRLEAHVSEVMPVSGLQWLLALHTSDDILDKMAFLASRTPEADLRSLFAEEPRFRSDRPSISLDLRQRTEVYSAIEHVVTGGVPGAGTGTYPILKYAVMLAQRRGADTGGKLRALLKSQSNIERLLEVLHRRFFDVSSLIQAGSVLSQALGVCRSGCANLRRELDLMHAINNLAPAVEKTMADGTPIPKPVQDYLCLTLPMLKGRLVALDETLRTLHRMADETEDDFRLLLSDIECQDLLRHPAVRLPDILVAKGRLLFGQKGLDQMTRLGLPASAGSTEIEVAASDLLQKFQDMQWSGNKDIHRIVGHAVVRLNAILDSLVVRGMS